MKLNVEFQEPDRKKKIKRIIAREGLAVIILSLFMSGCATTAKYEAMLNTWVGHKESELVSSWGAPQNVYDLYIGKRSIEYIRGTTMQLGGYTYQTPQTTYHRGMVGNTIYSGTSTQYVAQQTPVYNVPVWCKTSFIIDSNGIIESWRWEGNNCVSDYCPSRNTTTETNFKKLVLVEGENRGDIGGKNIEQVDAILGKPVDYLNDNDKFNTACRDYLVKGKKVRVYFDKKIANSWRILDE